MTAPATRETSGKARSIGIGAILLLLVLSVVAIYWLTKGGGVAWIQETVRALDRQVRANYPLAIGIFLAIALVIQCFIVPTGTIVMLTGGFLFGGPLAAGMYHAAQLVAAPIVYGAIRLGFGGYADAKLDDIVRRYLPERFSNLTEMARSEGVMAAVSLRLAPVITSAIVPILAAASGIKLWALLVGSVLAGWVRPLFWASVGASAHSLAEVSNPSDILHKVNLLPIALACLAAAMVFALRVYLKMRTQSGTSAAPKA